MLRNIEIIETWQGYSIRGYIDKYARPVYVSGCRKGKYILVTDYLYAKYFSEKTAKKHVKELEKMYTIQYKLHSADQVRQISLCAKNKPDAYDRAVYELIPEKEGTTPYSAWVHSVTYQNGNYRLFNNFEGNPY